MHLTLVDQTNGDTTVVCIDRTAKSCTVLRGDLDLMDTLLNVAASMHISDAKAIISNDPSTVAAFEEMGWERTTEVVMRKQLNGIRRSR